MALTIIRRALWGARAPNGCEPAPLPAREVWLHHSATVAPDLVPPWDDDDAAVRTLERIGQERFGCGISYTWPITPSGRVYEGHGVDRQGTHTGGRNGFARAICFVGNYESTRPTEAQINAAAALLRHAHAVGWITAPRLSGGHRDVRQTECPGDAAYALIAEINRRAAGGQPIEEDELTPDQMNEIKAFVKDTVKECQDVLFNILRGQVHSPGEPFKTSAAHADMANTTINDRLRGQAAELVAVRDGQAQLVEAVAALQPTVAADLTVTGTVHVTPAG